MRQSWKVGIDVGGTFTDIVLERSGGGDRQVVVTKVPSTPHDQSEGVVEGIEDREAEGALGLGAAPVERHRGDDVRGELVLDQQVAHLGAVAVGEQHLVAGRDELDDGVGADVAGSAAH